MPFLGAWRFEHWQTSVTTLRNAYSNLESCTWDMTSSPKFQKGIEPVLMYSWQCKENLKHSQIQHWLNNLESLSGILINNLERLDTLFSVPFVFSALSIGYLQHLKMEDVGWLSFFRWSSWSTMIWSALLVWISGLEATSTDLWSTFSCIQYYREHG